MVRIGIPQDLLYLKNSYKILLLLFFHGHQLHFFVPMHGHPNSVKKKRMVFSWRPPAFSRSMTAPTSLSVIRI